MTVETRIRPGVPRAPHTHGAPHFQNTRGIPHFQNTRGIPHRDKPDFVQDTTPATYPRQSGRICRSAACNQSDGTPLPPTVWSFRQWLRGLGVHSIRGTGKRTWRPRLWCLARAGTDDPAHPLPCTDYANHFPGHTRMIIILMHRAQPFSVPGQRQFQKNMDVAGQAPPEPGASVALAVNAPRLPAFQLHSAHRRGWPTSCFLHRASC